MSAYIKWTLAATWLIVIFYWLWNAFRAKRKSVSESVGKRLLLYWLPPAVAGFLLGPGEWFGHTWLHENFVPHTDTVGIIGLSVCVAGAVIACWSRFLLGRNWAISVQLKQEHELIVAGPYAYVRHPIYTGLLMMFAGNAIIVGDYRGILAVMIVFVSFWYKLRKEEIWLGNLFGEKYNNYKKNTHALFPWIL